MPNPKHKFSQSRRDKRRTHDALTSKPFYIDPETGSATLYHRVCLDSGMYRGRKVLSVAADVSEEATTDES
jgi:large subunit ribosomal protein L32